MRPWRRLKAAGAAAVLEAGQRVAVAVTASQRAVVGALVAGLVAGALLTWLGVSLGRQGT